MNESTRYTLFAIAILGAMVWLSQDFLPALAWGGLLALALSPIHQKIASVSGNWQATTILTMAILCVVILPLGLIGQNIAHEAPAIRGMISQVLNTGIPINGLAEHHPQIYSHLQPHLSHFHLTEPDSESTLRVPPNLGQMVTPYLASNHHALLSGTVDAAHTIIHRVEIALFTLLSFATFISSGSRIREETNNLTIRCIGDQGPKHLQQAIHGVRGTVNGIILVGLAQAVLIMPALFIAHAPHPGIATAVIFAASLIPFCAPVAVAGTALFAMMGTGSTSAIIVLAWGMTVVFAGDHFLKPKLLGSSTKLGFLSSLIAILGGLKMLGILGLFISPALFSIGMTLWAEYTSNPKKPITEQVARETTD